MYIKESVRYTVFKNNNYTEQPSSCFLYIDDEKNTAGYYCYFCNKASEMSYWLTNTVILDEVWFTSKRYVKKVLNENFANDVLDYVKEYNKKYGTNFEKIAILDFYKNKRKKYKINGVKFLIYEV